MALYSIKDHSHEWTTETTTHDGYTTEIRRCTDPGCDAKEIELTEEQSGLDDYA